MTNPYRALCAELLAALEIQLDELRFNNRLCLRARALLDQPVAEGPSDEEISEVYWKGAGLVRAGTGEHILRGCRAVLAKWGHQ